jgi:hypothetical protein
VLIDLGPNFSAVNRSALLACDYVVVPVGADVVSRHGLSSLGVVLRDAQRASADFRSGGDWFYEPKAGAPIGYVVTQHGMRDYRSQRTHQRWLDRLPAAYRQRVLGLPDAQLPVEQTESDPHCLAVIENYRSLMPMAKDAKKPVFALKAADGALGAHGQAVLRAHADFLHLARTIATKVELKLD